MKQSFTRKLLYLGGVFISLIVLTVLFLFISSLKKAPTPPPSVQKRVPKNITTSLVKKVLPDSTQALANSQNQTFTITLDSALDPSLIKVQLVASPPSNATEKTAIPLSVSYDKNIITATTTKPIEPFTTYTLTLSLREQNILQRSYLSEALSPSPLPTNNAILSSYLPHETFIYLLEFDKDQNIYLMHFKYDATSPLSFTEQFEKAKKSVNEYIASKNIDPNTVIIKYLYK